MPSPVVHSLASLALDRFGRGPGWPGMRLFAALVVAGNAPDFDFIPGILIGEPGLFHHGPMHSLLAAAAFGAAAAPFARWLGFRSMWRCAVIMTLAFASHLFLDMMAVDDGAPSAVPLLWPLSDAMISLPLSLFIAIRVDPAVDGFVRSLLSAHNGNALLWEFVIVSVVMALVRVARRPQPAGRQARAYPISRDAPINRPRQYSD